MIYEYTSTVSGPTECEEAKDCKDLNESTGLTMDCIRGTCMYSSTYFHDAVSVAFGETGDDLKENDQWKTASTWTESVYVIIRIQIIINYSDGIDIIVG